MGSTSTESFAIYQTQKGIELHHHQTHPIGAELICVVSHYESALRIARQAAQIRQVPLVTKAVLSVSPLC
jgi:hypothetical protein